MEATVGVVEQAGLGTPDIVMEVKVGDRIMFKNGSDRIKVDGLVLLEQEDVLFILD